jgi:hypothetical protein
MVASPPPSSAKGEKGLIREQEQPIEVEFLSFSCRCRSSGKEAGRIGGGEKC